LSSLAPRPSPLTPRYIIGRDRDRPALERLGRVEVLARGPAVRFDRTYTLFRISGGRPDRATGDAPASIVGNDRPAARR
jgi:hypothetical protein